MKGLLVFITLCWALSAGANPLCGAYRNDQPGSDRWIIFSDNLFAKILEKNETQSLHRVNLQGNRLILRDLETGQMSEYNLQADRQQFETPGKDVFQERYRREKTGHCSVKTLAAPSCPQPATDEFSCAHSAYQQQDTLILQGLCQQGLAYACLKLADLRDREMRQSASSTALQNPAECAQANFPEDTCGSLLSRSLMQQISEVTRDTALGRTDQTWPQAYLDEFSNACQKIGSPELCRQATARMWNAGHYLRAKALLNHACQLQLDSHACMASKALERLGTQLADIQPAKSLPCGIFRPLNMLGLMRELEFTDRGMVNIAQDPMQARLVNGMVQVRHDKGADFIFRPIGTGWLLGADPWHRYTVFERQGGQAICSPPPGTSEHRTSKNHP